MQEINNITLEIISNAMLSIAEQMGVILTKTAYSTNIKERKDLSVAVFDPKGKLLSLAQHIPLHFSSLSGAISVLLSKTDVSDIHDGDVFIANDPYSGGGSHLPDLVLLKPVFYRQQLIAFMANTGHHADKSRRGPTIYDEGLRIPVIKLMDRGVMRDDLMELILTNYQMKYERQGDIRAQLTTNQFGADKLIELVEKIGLPTYQAFCVKWLEYGERKARAAIRELPDGVYCFHDYLDSDGSGHEDLLIDLKLKIKGDTITFDFTGSCDQVTGCYNCVPCALEATIYYSLKCVLDNTIPANSGFFDSIIIEARPGTLVYATEPAPTSDRETTTQRIADVIFGAFAQIDPKMVIAAGNGSMSFFTCLGSDRRSGKPYVYVETIGGGSGARYNKDGMDAVQVHMTNTSNLPVEALEMEYPLMVEQYALSENSAGAGKYRGGMGIIRSVRILEESGDTVLTAASVERARRRPWGLCGGHEGGLADFRVIRDGEVICNEQKPRNIPLQTGDIIVLTTAGAGGFGDPKERDPQKVAEELREGKIDQAWVERAMR